jgi:tetratricopeptide (TPR) repeat protein
MHVRRIFPELIFAATAGAALLSAQSAIQEVSPATGAVASTLVVSGSVQRTKAEEDIPLPSDLRISIDCHHGDFFDGGSVTLSGQFRFTMTPDPGGIAASNICTAEAKAFGYESSTARFPVRSSSGVVDIGALVIRKTASGDAQDLIPAGTAKTVSATSLKAPANAVKLFDEGTRFLKQGKFPNAAKSFEAATRIYEEYAEAWLGLGSARVSLGSLDTARPAFLRAAELDPQMAQPPAELGLLAARQNDLVTAAKYLDQSLRLDPVGSYQTCYSDALVNFILKRYNVVEQSARAALQFGENAEHARADYLLGISLMIRGENGEARQRLTRYLDLAPNAPEKDEVKKQIARLDQLKTDQLKTDQLKTDQLKTDQLKTDQLKTDQLKTP